MFTTHLPRTAPLLAGCVAIFALCLHVRAEEFPAPELREGDWISRGVKNILGAGRDEILSLRRVGTGWTVERTYFYHPSVNTHRGPEYSRSGASPIRRDSIYLVEEASPGIKPGRRTFRWEGERLVYPAVVRTGARTWRFVSPGRQWDLGMEWEFRCKQNPLDAPLGEAELEEKPGEVTTGTYVYELLPPGAADDPNAKPPPAQLRFLVRQGNALEERFSLRWDHWGAPSYWQRSRRSADAVGEVRYEPISREALEKLLASATERAAPNSTAK